MRRRRPIEKRGVSRRMFLRGAGATAIGLPFLASLMTPGRAAAVAPPRVVFFITGNGTVPDAFWPTGSETSFELSTPILAPLAAHKADLLLLRGVNNLPGIEFRPPGSHPSGAGGLLTGARLQDNCLFGDGDRCHGWADGISVDQHIAQALDHAPFRSLELGARMAAGMTDVATRMSYRGPADPVDVEFNPYAAFTRIFGGTMPVGGGDTMAVERTHALRRSVLDHVLEDYEATRIRVGAEDRVKLDQHLESIRALERRLTDPTVTSAECATPALTAGIDYQDQSRMPEIGRMQMELIAMALACNLTRVVTFQWGGEGGASGSMPWLGFSDNHHLMTHRLSNATDHDKVTQINAWYAEQFAWLIERLKSIPEGSDTVFDSTVLVWLSPLGHGGHVCDNIPFVLAGGAGDYFRTGRYLVYDGQPHNNLLVSLCNAMGLDDTSFGDPDFCTGPLEGLR